MQTWGNLKVVLCFVCPAIHRLSSGLLRYESFLYSLQATKWMVEPDNNPKLISSYLEKETDLTSGHFQCPCYVKCWETFPQFSFYHLQFTIFLESQSTLLNTKEIPFLDAATIQQVLTCSNLNHGATWYLWKITVNVNLPVFVSNRHSALLLFLSRWHLDFPS